MEDREITREDYRYGYQGQYSEEDNETGWNAFELRMYDARIGRWNSPDPYGQFESPYVGMGNLPHINTDPDGGFTGGEKTFLLETVEVTATRLPYRSFSTAALKSLSIIGPRALRRSSPVVYSDRRSQFYRNIVEPLTDKVHGIARSLMGDVTPNWYSSSPNREMDIEVGEKYVGPLVQMAFSPTSVFKRPGPGLSLIPNRPNVTIKPSVAPSVSAQSVHNMSSLGSALEVEYHHLLPQAKKFRKFFEAAGLDIEQFKIPLDKAKHRLKPNGVHTIDGGNWNKRWDEFFEANPFATKEEILEFMNKLRTEFGI
jgi:RHS repeat-associated protein